MRMETRITIVDSADRDSGRTDMIEKERIARLMEILIEDCRRCPLERICDESNCADVWERFLGSKVKEGGIDICRN